MRATMIMAAPTNKTTSTKTTSKAAMQSKEDARAARRHLVGQVLRTARGEYTQAQLAEMLSRVRGSKVLQTSISRWEAGDVTLDFEQARDVEQALGLEKGSLAISAGYVSTDASVPALIRSDPTIHPNFRGDLERLYMSYREMSTQLTEAESRAGRRR